MIEPPKRFYPLLLLFHAFPLHAPLTLWGLDAPFGRFAQTSKWNLNGNLAWFFMESVAPITLFTTLSLKGTPPLSSPAKILAGLYLTHYLHRAVISPLILSPKRSDLQAIVPISAAAWNLMNASLIAMGLAYFPSTTTLSSPRFVLGVLGWAVGFLGNVYHDEILNDLRRPREKRLIPCPSSQLKEEEVDKKVAGGRYAIPRGALFEWIAFPNYLCEWFEWLSFAFAAAPLFIPVPPREALFLDPWLNQITQNLPFWPNYLLSPGYMFLLAEISAMVPRAVRSQAWYEKTFKERYPKDRKIVIPGIF